MVPNKLSAPSPGARFHPDLRFLEAEGRIVLMWGLWSLKSNKQRGGGVNAVAWQQD